MNLNNITNAPSTNGPSALNTEQFNSTSIEKKNRYSLSQQSPGFATEKPSEKPCYERDIQPHFTQPETHMTGPSQLDTKTRKPSHPPQKKQINDGNQPDPDWLTSNEIRIQKGKKGKKDFQKKNKADTSKTEHRLETTQIAMIFRNGKTNMIKQLKELIKGGFDLNKTETYKLHETYSSMTPLMYAIHTCCLRVYSQNSSMNAVKFLLKENADPNKKCEYPRKAFPDLKDDSKDDVFLFTPLALATMKQNYALMKTLLEYKADGNTFIVDGVNLLHFLCTYLDLEGTIILLDNAKNEAINVNQVMRGKAGVESALHLVIKNLFTAIDQNKCCRNRCAELIIRAKNIIKLLLLHPIDTAIKNTDGKTAFQYAKERFDSYKYIEMNEFTQILSLLEEYSALQETIKP